VFEAFALAAVEALVLEVELEPLGLLEPELDALLVLMAELAS